MKKIKQRFEPFFSFNLQFSICFHSNLPFILLILLNKSIKRYQMFHFKKLQLPNKSISNQTSIYPLSPIKYAYNQQPNFYLYFVTLQILQQIKNYSEAFKMNHINSLNNLQNYQETLQHIAHAQKVREVYISSFKQTKLQGIKQTYKTSPCKFNKFDHQQLAESLPPKAHPFRRSSKNSSKDRIDHSRENSGEFKYISKANEPSRKQEANSDSLQKRLNQQAAERKRLKSFCSLQEQKIKQLQQLLAKSQQEKETIKKQLTNTQQILMKNEKEIAKANQLIQSLNKSLKESKINQKSLNNLKNIQNQVDLLQQRNLKLTQENDQLIKSNKKMRNDLMKKKDSTSQSQPQFNKRQQKIKSLQLQVSRLKQQLQKDRSQRQLFLQSNLHQLQKKLFQKQNEIKKISIRLNYLDRKKYDCIDQIKTKKDQEIKDLRHKFNKVSKDLKETKNKYELTQKKRTITPSGRSPLARKIKSSTLLGGASESQVTFQFSSQS